MENSFGVTHDLISNPVLIDYGNQVNIVNLIQHDFGDSSLSICLVEIDLWFEEVIIVTV